MHIFDVAPEWFILVPHWNVCEDYDKEKGTPITGYNCGKNHGKRCCCWCAITYKDRAKNPSGYGCQSVGRLDWEPFFYPATIKEVLDNKAKRFEDMNDFQRDRIVSQ